MLDVVRMATITLLPAAREDAVLVRGAACWHIPAVTSDSTYQRSCLTRENQTQQRCVAAAVLEPHFGTARA